MAKVEFPKPLKELLEESDLQAPIRALADRAGEILADNKLPFFPDYTDHGTEHINRVLKSEVDLVPKRIWEESKKESDPRLLCDADAAVLIGATLLHDIAMHLRPEGFLELVGRDSRFSPLPWFKESHEGHSADRPWRELWEDYVREARRFSDRDLTNIIGEASARVWKFHTLPDDTGQWERNHGLIIGEFIRRHHARLAHEVAVYGFPGLPVGSGEGQFPAMGKEEGHPLMRLADLIGLTARSHGTSLRVCKSYLDSSPLYPGTPKPMGSAVLYAMALLRVADYLQIDRQRAPAVLLQLRNPQSPVSIQEWQKHRAVQNIGPATDPRAKMVTVSTDVSLSLYLQLRDLLASLQAEMDHSTAVLDEAYGTLTELGMNQLGLATRRIYSNLQSPAFRDSLPYVPDQTGFTADPHLLTLLVEPLYGKQPSVGVRELMQNGADAVCELEAWCTAHGISVDSLDLPEQDGDVLIEFIKREDGSWFLRVRDRGIGMSADTIHNYFLRAGASFRRSPEWAKEFLDEQGHPRVIRAGRFGIGAFAVFLLGPSFRLWTRHAAADKSMGYAIAASANSQLIEIRRVDGLPIGTTIEAELSKDSVASLAPGARGRDPNWQRRTDWFCWDWPKVVRRVTAASSLSLLRQRFASPIRKSRLPPTWSVIYPEPFDAVYWTFEDAPRLSCNGLIIAQPKHGMHERAYFHWPEETQLNSPCVAVLDSAANLPLTTQRYELSQATLPFIDELVRDVTLSFIAYALVRGPASALEARSSRNRSPLQLHPFSTYDDPSRGGPFSHGRLRWCATAAEMVPADPWLYSLLNAGSCVVCGALRHSHSYEELGIDSSSITEPVNVPTTAGVSILRWDGRIVDGGDSQTTHTRVSGFQAKILAELAHQGVLACGHDVEASQVLISVDRKFEYGFASTRVPNYFKHLGQSDYSRSQFEATKGAFIPSISLEAVLDAMEADRRDATEDPHSSRRQALPAVLYVSEIKTRQTPRNPESVIATVWNECLGARAIPFDQAARQSLIADGCKHPELKSHIDRALQMKSSIAGRSA